MRICATFIVRWKSSRVAMGRAIVREPKVFLMDEPLSNLDAKLRVQMRIEISKLHQRLQSTIIYVTHDQTEAMTLGTRIVVMKDGYVKQIAAPKEMFDKPEDLFVAGFLPHPGITVRIRFNLGSVNVSMIQINLINLKNVCINVIEDFLNRIR